MEIERKFIIDTTKLDNEFYKTLTVQHFTQTYLEISKDDSEVRVRAAQSVTTGRVVYLYTEKGDGNLVRKERNEEIDRATYETLLKKEIVGKAIEKERHTLLIEDVIAEIDIYQGALVGLEIAEIEFPTSLGWTTEKIRSMPLPEPLHIAIIKEVTDDKRYKNKNLARYGRPPESTLY